MRRLFSVLLFAACAFAQTHVTNGTGGGGVDLSGVPTNAVLGKISGAVGGDSNLISIFASLPTPAAPTITHGGTPGVTGYGYVLYWKNAVGNSAAGDVGSTTTGNATLDGTNFNIITPPTCPAGATGYIVNRSAGGVANGYLPPDGVCGVAYHDTGQDPVSYAGVNTFDTSRGVFNGYNSKQPSQGDQPWQFYSGNDAEDFSGGNAARSMTSGSIWQFSYHGTVNTLSSGLQVGMETTDGGVPWIISAYGFTTGGTQAGAYGGIFGNSGASDVSDAFGVQMYPYTLAAGNIGTAHDYVAGDGVNTSTGTVGQMTGYECPNLSSGTTGNTCLLSFMSAGPGKLALNLQGTASSFFGGPIIETPHTPASSSEACTIGQHASDASFEYRCTSANTWRRVALSSF